MGRGTKGRLAPTILAILVCAISLVGAASAQAEPFFEADSYPATIDSTALGPSIFFFGSFYAFTCHGGSFSGKLTTKSNSLTLTPTYSNCSWSYPVTEPQQPYSPVKVAMNGCDFRLHTGKRLEPDRYQTLVSLECPNGQQVVMELTSGGLTICRLTVPAQSKSTVDVTDKTGAVHDLELQPTVAKLKYTQDLGFCPVKIGTYEDLNYTGLSTLTATSEAGKQIGLRVTGE